MIHDSIFYVVLRFFLNSNIPLWISYLHTVADLHRLRKSGREERVEGPTQWHSGWCYYFMVRRLCLIPAAGLLPVGFWFHFLLQFPPTAQKLIGKNESMNGVCALWRTWSVLDMFPAFCLMWPGGEHHTTPVGTMHGMHGSKREHKHSRVVANEWQ